MEFLLLIICASAKISTKEAMIEENQIVPFTAAIDNSLVKWTAEKNWLENRRKMFQITFRTPNKQFGWKLELASIHCDWNATNVDIRYIPCQWITCTRLRQHIFLRALACSMKMRFGSIRRCSICYTSSSGGTVRLLFVQFAHISCIISMLCCLMCAFWCVFSSGIFSMGWK